MRCLHNSFIYSFVCVVYAVSSQGWFYTITYVMQTTLSTFVFEFCSRHQYIHRMTQTNVYMHSSLETYFIQMFRERTLAEWHAHTRVCIRWTIDSAYAHMFFQNQRRCVYKERILYGVLVKRFTIEYYFNILWFY